MINGCCQLNIFFERNWKTTGAAAACAVVATTTLVLGILGWLNTITLFHSASVPISVTSLGVLALDASWIITLFVCGREKKEQKVKSRRQRRADPTRHHQATNRIPQTETHRQSQRRADPTRHHQEAHRIPQTEKHKSRRRTVFKCELPLNTKEYELKQEKGDGFPLVDRNKRQEVLKQTLEKQKKLEKSSKDIQPYIKEIKYYPSTNSASSLSFFPEGDVLQTPVRMDYDHNFEPMQAKNYFFMHSSAAPKRRHFPEDEEENYLQAMEEGYFNLLQCQVLSGAEHILTNYWGMGAFIRNYYNDEDQMCAFRCRIAQRLANAYCRVVDANPEHKFTFYIGGPTGESFRRKLQEEPRDNYNAFVQAFGYLDEKYKQNVVMCPETDIFVKGQMLSDIYQCSDGQLAPVSAINAADPDKFGNLWYEGSKPGGGFNAEFAIEENVFRRAPFLGFIAKKINEKSPTCKAGVEKLVSAY